MTPPIPESVVEDIAWMVTTGEWPERIAARAGLPSAATAARLLHRRGRHDLAKVFDRFTRESNPRGKHPALRERP